VNGVQHRAFAICLSWLLLGMPALTFPCNAFGQASGSPKSSRPTDSAVQWWLAAQGGYGRMDVYFRDRSDEPVVYQGTANAASYGARLGLGGFSGRHLQMGGEISFFGVQATEITRANRLSILDGRQTKSVGFVAFTPIGLVLTGYAFDRHGPFLSGAVRGGVGVRWRDQGMFAGAYAVSVGYALRDLLGNGRTSVAFGYEASGTSDLVISSDDANTLYDAHQFTLALQVEM
jgi:hypothetical protein